MSYILDALKKSEEERRKGDLPGLQTYTPLPQVDGKKKGWFVLVAVLVIVNVAIVLLWSPWSQEGEVVTPVQSISTKTQAVEVEAISERPHVRMPIEKPRASMSQPVTPLKVLAPTPVRSKEPPSVATQAYIDESPVVQAKAQAPPAPSRHRVPETSYMPQLSEISEDIRSQIPDLTFSSHMFSSKSRFRSITINGKRLKEGKYYDEHLFVSEITEKGAVLSFDGTFFEVDVLGQWSD
ncbi:hypothetical protein A9Q99_20380 [Gammaproteobacteria bacterium 45_16_T64]|nr:hypothetical protein A9Q99_20380 [Gammaproteobacteria bacterium 45_16_T64]